MVLRWVGFRQCLVVPTGQVEQRRRAGGRASADVVAGAARAEARLDPLAAPLRQRYPSRPELARASGLKYQLLRTYTDGQWTADHLPPVRVLAALSQAVDPTELQRAIRAAMLARTDQSQGPPR